MSDKILRILHGALKSPPMSTEARVESGVYLRELQESVMLTAPVSKPMPSIGKRCHELRIQDENVTWRIIYRIDSDEIVVAEMFSKKTQKTPLDVIKNCKARYKKYDER